MPNSWTARIVLIVSLAALIGMMMGCAQENQVITDLPQDDQSLAIGCVGCHTDAAMLQATADPVDAPPPSTGEG